jgi:hypothetical protein
MNPLLRHFETPSHFRLIKAIESISIAQNLAMAGPSIDLFAGSANLHSHAMEVEERCG